MLTFFDTSDLSSDQSKEKRLRLLFPLLVVAIVTGGFLSCALASNDLWLDEAATLAIANRHSLSEIAKIAANDVHPPLYYWLLSIWSSLFSTSTVAAKVLSVVPCVIIVFHGVIFLAQLRRYVAANLFAFLFCASAPVVEISIDIRMYSWAAFFVFETGLCCYRILTDNKTLDFALLGIFASLSAWTHYAAGITAFSLIAWTSATLLVFHKSRKSIIAKCALTASVCTGLYLPWLIVLFRQMNRVNQGEFWVKSIPGLRTVRLCIYGIFDIGQQTITIILIVLAIFSFSRLAYSYFSQTKHRKVQSDFPATTILATAPFATAAFLILYSRLVSPVYTLRYVAPSVPLLLFATAMALEVFLPKQVLKIAIIILPLCSIRSIVHQLKEEFRYGKRWETFVTLIDSKIVPETQFIHLGNTPNHSGGILTYLQPSHPHFFASDIKHIDFYRPGADWRNLNDVDWTKPWCLIIPSNLNVGNGNLPIQLQERSFDTVYPSKSFAKGWRLYWGGIVSP